MTRLKDGGRTVIITLQEYRCGNLSPDFSADFYSVGDLQYDAENDAYLVPDVEYCIEQALDWKFARYDFDEDNVNPDNRIVMVDDELL